MGSNERPDEGWIGFRIAEAIPGVGPQIAVGGVAGYSITLVGADAVSLPFVGPVSGPLLGLLGLGVSAAAFRRLGCGNCCGSNSRSASGDCGCSDGRGDRCSHDG